MKHKLATFEEEGLYHVYNRANGNERLFLSENNYQYFLRKYKAYIEPFVDTFCYCLMPNHFHFLIRVKKQSEIEESLKAKSNFKSKNQDLKGFQNLAALKSRGPLPKFGTLAEVDFSFAISKKFANFFSSYTQSFNKKHNRKGSLFMKPFKRKRISDEKYLRKLIHYIHYNPIEAGLARELADWKYSSYPALISNKKTNISREEVIELYESRSNFIYCHQIASLISSIEGDN